MLTGEPSDRVVRALADHSGEMTVPELIKLSGASTGATYRVVEVLMEREFIRRIPRGGITEVRWEQMLRAWAADRKMCATRRFAAPDGLEIVRNQLAERIDITYASAVSVPPTTQNPTSWNCMPTTPTTSPAHWDYVPWTAVATWWWRFRGRRWCSTAWIAPGLCAAWRRHMCTQTCCRARSAIRKPPNTCVHA